MPSIKRKKIAARFTLSFHTLFAIVKTQNGDFCEVHSVGKGAAKITLRLQKGLKRETSDEGEIML